MTNIHKQLHYGFRCKFCGSADAYVVKYTAHCHKLLTFTFDSENPKKGIWAKMKEEPESNIEGTRDYSQITCAGCGAFWGSPMDAFTAGSMYLERVTSVQDGYTFVEDELSEDQQNGLDVFTEYWGNAVRCSCCGWSGFTVPTAKRCPCCRESSTLTFQHENKHSAECAHACYCVIGDYPEAEGD